MLAKLVQIISLKVGDRPDLLRSFIYSVKYTCTSLGSKCLVGGPVLVEGLGPGPASCPKCGPDSATTQTDKRRLHSSMTSFTAKDVSER